MIFECVETIKKRLIFTAFLSASLILLFRSLHHSLMHNDPIRLKKPFLFSFSAP